MKYVIQGRDNPNFLVSMDTIPEWDPSLSKAKKFDSLEDIKKWRSGLSLSERAFLTQTRIVPMKQSYH